MKEFKVSHIFSVTASYVDLTDLWTWRKGSFDAERVLLFHL